VQQLHYICIQFAFMDFDPCCFHSDLRADGCISTTKVDGCVPACCHGAAKCRVRSSSSTKPSHYNTATRASSSNLLIVFYRLATDSFPIDAETDLEAFSNDILESASGWGGASLDTDAGKQPAHTRLFRELSRCLVAMCRSAE
jgi:hypothetical protein